MSYPEGTIHGWHRGASRGIGKGRESNLDKEGYKREEVKGGFRWWCEAHPANEDIVLDRPDNEILPQPRIDRIWRKASHRNGHKYKESLYYSGFNWIRPVGWWSANYYPPPSPPTTPIITDLPTLLCRFFRIASLAIYEKPPNIRSDHTKQFLDPLAQ